MMMMVVMMPPMVHMVDVGVEAVLTGMCGWGVCLLEWWLIFYIFFYMYSLMFSKQPQFYFNIMIGDGRLIGKFVVHRTHIIVVTQLIDLYMQ